MNHSDIENLKKRNDEIDITSNGCCMLICLFIILLLIIIFVIL